MVRVGEKHAFWPQVKILSKIPGPTAKGLAFSHLNPVAWSKANVFSISMLFPHLRNHCWGFRQGGTWQKLQGRAHNNLEQGLIRGAPAGSSVCPLHRRCSAWLPASWQISCHSTGVPSHSTGPPSPWTCNSYPPQSITGALGLKLGKGKRTHIFITVIKSDTFLVWRPRSCISPPSGFLLSCCVFWMAYPGVCCVNVHENVMHLLHTGAVSNSMCLPTTLCPLQWVPLWHIGALSTGMIAGLDHKLPATLLRPGYLRKGRQNCSTCWVCSTET